MRKTADFLGKNVGIRSRFFALAANFACRHNTARFLPVRSADGSNLAALGREPFETPVMDDRLIKTSKEC
jgi:hypothetical protein